MEVWLNIIHYCIYKADYKLHLLSNKVNPFLLLGKIPAVKRKFEEQGTSQQEVGNKVWGDKRYGFSVMISGGGLTLLVFLLIWTAFLVLNDLVEYPISFSWQPFVICIGLAYTTCHLLVFYKDQYLKYFKEFEKWTKSEKRKYGILSFVFVVGVITLFMFSFRFFA